MEAAQTVSPGHRQPLVDVAHAQSNALFDVLALLVAIGDRIDAHSSARADDEMHHTLRLAHIAQGRVQEVIDAFDPFI